MQTSRANADYMPQPRVPNQHGVARDYRLGMRRRLSCVAQLRRRAYTALALRMSPKGVRLSISEYRVYAYSGLERDSKSAEDGINGRQTAAFAGSGSGRWPGWHGEGLWLFRISKIVHRALGCGVCLSYSASLCTPHL
jgi:hypothetical protein